MKYNIKEFGESIKKIRLILDKTKKREAIEEAIKKFKVSRRTIYRHLKKKIPGIRKHRNDAGKWRKKPKPKAIKAIKEAVIAGKTIQEGKKIIEKITGEKITNAKLMKISQKIKEEGVKSDNKIFSDNIKKFLSKYFKLDFIAPESEIEIKLGDAKFKILREDFEDIILILTNAYNRNALCDKKKKLDRDELREKMLMNLFEEQINIAKETGNIKDVELLTRIYDRMKKGLEVDVNIKTLEAVCKEIKPDITLSEIINILKRVG